MILFIPQVYVNIGSHQVRQEQTLLPQFKILFKWLLLHPNQNPRFIIKYNNMIDVQLMDHFKEVHLLTLVEHIGQGLASNVYLGKDQQGKSYAIKVYDFINGSENTNKSRNIQIDRNSRLYLQYQMECSVLKWLKLKDPDNIIQFQQNGSFGHYGYIIMEYVENSLYTLLCAVETKNQQGGLLNMNDEKVNKRLDRENIRHIAQQLVYGLSSLEREHIIHRDLKMENVLLTQNNSVKLIDFATIQIVRQLNTSPEQLDQQWKRILELDEALNTSQDYLVGTKYYVCPELISGKRARVISHKIDIWAFGIILYRLLCGDFPFRKEETQNNSKYYDKIRTQEPNYPEFLLQDQKQIIENCLKKNPKERPSASQLQNYSYFLPNNKNEVSINNSQLVKPLLCIKSINFCRKVIKKQKFQLVNVDLDKSTEPNREQLENQAEEPSDEPSQGKQVEYSTERYRGSDILIQINRNQEKVLLIRKKQNKKLQFELPVSLMKIEKINSKKIKINRTDNVQEHYALQFSSCEQAEQFISAAMAQI